MDIFTCIADDHKRINALIDDLLSIHLQSVQRNLFGQIRSALIVHRQAKHQGFYQALAQAGLNEEVEHANLADYEIRDLLDKLNAEAVASANWMEMFGELKHAFEMHVRHEETAVFPKARQALAPQLSQQLAEDMQDLIQQAQAEAETQTEIAVR